MKDINININLGKALPKLATVLPLVVITANSVINIAQEKSFSNSEYIWSGLGLIAAIYFGVFCKEIKL
ncbi:TPA: bacteriocin immunity protein [Streptococcus suis]|uniref:bacteriocin immunity protein n=1 Tax=Streptococcus suis TaxID=1307 RepID=UPI002A869EE6|nr:bacteriocin immunity protein [Streptococcus suis]HEM5070916.1 bacteriocin immunity protein [Streptococcus suis]HEM5205335.1 bacteriocin immunity protein [Streptococcus suis]HEM5215752.1 bacteriocin immunity protein [Streptococcus suis]